jgi:hypothetical protein
MNDHDFDLTARAWLEDGPTRMSDRALASTLKEIHRTRQRRGRWPAWRAIPASGQARVAIAAVLVVAVGLMTGTVVLRQSDRSSVGGQALDVPELTTTFVSPRNGFSIKHPGEVLITPAEDLWFPDNYLTDRGVDVVETDRDGVFKGASSEIPDALERPLVDWASIDAWLGDPSASRTCGGPLSQQAEITIDGAFGRIAECPGEIVATVFAGGRLYRFTLLHERGDARAAFDAYSATIDLIPETAVDYPGLASTFVSPTYGYSFGYIDRGGLGPASVPWDPVTQPLADTSGARLDPFDVVVTGHGAFFKSASTVIPDGVSIDAWVDEYVSIPGCSLGRAHQDEITIDGLSGRILECPDRIDATVVAGGRLYLFTLLHDRTDAREFFDAWVATIELRPEDAALPPITESP